MIAEIIIITAERIIIIAEIIIMIALACLKYHHDCSDR